MLGKQQNGAKKGWVSDIHGQPTAGWLLGRIEAKMVSDAEIEAANDEHALANLIFPDWEARIAEAVSTSPFPSYVFFVIATI